MSADAPSALLAPWANFFTMTAASAASLTGLMFVVITLVSGRQQGVAQEGIAVYSTPTVVHFATALLVSAILIAPWPSLVDPSVAAALVGVYGLQHIVRAALRQRRFTNYQADLEDWTWYTAVPLLAHGAIAAGAIALAAVPGQALFAIAGGVLLLIFLGIRNAWDVVTYITIHPS